MKWRRCCVVCSLGTLLYAGDGAWRCRPGHGRHLETSGVNALGPWKLTWQIRENSSYSLSGLFRDSGTIGSGDGRWHIVSNATKQSADGTYSLTDANHMFGTGALGSAVWNPGHEQSGVSVVGMESI